MSTEMLSPAVNPVPRTVTLVPPGPPVGRRMMLPARAPGGGATGTSVRVVPGVIGHVAVVISAVRLNPQAAPVPGASPKGGVPVTVVRVRTFRASATVTAPLN